MSRVITTVAGIIFVSASLILSPAHSSGTAGARAQSMHKTLFVDETTTTTTTAAEPVRTTAAEPAPATVPAATTEPVATTLVVPVAPPANITGAHLPGKADNAPLVPGHWTQDVGGAIYRDPSPDTDNSPTVGSTDPAYEDGLNIELCAAKPWICGL